MMSLWDALRMNMMISYQELVRTFLKMREDAPPLNLTEETTPPFPTKANYLIHPVR